MRRKDALNVFSQCTVFRTSQKKNTLRPNIRSTHTIEIFRRERHPTKRNEYCRKEPVAIDEAGGASPSEPSLPSFRLQETFRRNLPNPQPPPQSPPQPPTPNSPLPTSTSTPLSHSLASSFLPHNPDIPTHFPLGGVNQRKPCPSLQWREQTCTREPSCALS